MYTVLPAQQLDSFVRILLNTYFHVFNSLFHLLLNRHFQTESYALSFNQKVYTAVDIGPTLRKNELVVGKEAQC